MRIIEINAFENGSHRNQTGTFEQIPDGWAVIPDDMETPNFPFGDITVKKIDGIVTVTEWSAKNVDIEPFPKYEEPEPFISNCI